ncbi:hypothetical protein [Sphaerisporangium sp. TRM90804]|uniref:hypothetical protein n=1 Tax=Sphaerisporangium sp. TRM90804 TaxID=3031113 RepID=UPI00244A75C2|nr:hypothetical protein [Sphaerisporangium sp. TRM90804]MDH2427677.1 hypothetical protein [Sphaerisporangium sp. TRM90804]
MRRLARAFTGAGTSSLAVGLGIGLTVGVGLGLAVGPVWPGEGSRTGGAWSASAQPSPSGPPAPSPAPARWEEAYATEILLAHPTLGGLVRETYAETAGRRLSSPGDLRVHTLIFRRHGCEAHRCLQLFIRFPGGTWLDVGRVIADLTVGEIRVLPW